MEQHFVNITRAAGSVVRTANAEPHPFRVEHDPEHARTIATWSAVEKSAAALRRVRISSE